MFSHRAAMFSHTVSNTIGHSVSDPKLDPKLVKSTGAHPASGNAGDNIFILKSSVSNKTTPSVIGLIFFVGGNCSISKREVLIPVVAGLGDTYSLSKDWQTVRITIRERNCT